MLPQEWRSRFEKKVYGKVLRRFKKVNWRLGKMIFFFGRDEEMEGGERVVRKGESDGVQLLRNGGWNEEMRQSAIWKGESGEVF